VNVAERRRLGRTDAWLTALGFGSAPLGDLYAPLSEVDAEAALQAAWDAGVRYFDTAPWYGRGLSEHRVGRFLRGQARREFVISTKVGRILRPSRQWRTFAPAPWAGGLPFDVLFDYSYDGILRGYEDSLQRLGLTHVDIALVHDLDPGYHAPAEMARYFAQLQTGGWRALDELRSADGLKAIGAGVNRLGLIPRLLDAFDIDVFLLAMPYTLLDQGALDAELPMCVEREVGVVIGAPFASGILATGPMAGSRYDYGSAPPDVMARAIGLQVICERHGVPLAAAALQFPIAHPAVTTVIPGAVAAREVRENVEHFRRPIPVALWEELKASGLLRPDAPTPGPAP
jgi:D-threo-aldose 1-dehydrogenase